MPDNGVKIALIIDELLHDYILVVITIEKDAKKWFFSQAAKRVVLFELHLDAASYEVIMEFDCENCSIGSYLKKSTLQVAVGKLTKTHEFRIGRINSIKRLSNNKNASNTSRWLTTLHFDCLHINSLR